MMIIFSRRYSRLEDLGLQLLSETKINVLQGNIVRCEQSFINIYYKSVMDFLTPNLTYFIFIVIYKLMTSLASGSKNKISSSNLHNSVNGFENC